MRDYAIDSVRGYAERASDFGSVVEELWSPISHCRVVMLEFE
jgi:hypothetical protein